AMPDVAPASAGGFSPPLLRQLQLFARAGSRSSFDGFITSPLIRERAALALQSVSPTRLEDFGECPQKFFFKEILGVRDFDDPERDVQINRREKGTLDHRILERFYREAPAGEPLDGALDERIERIVDEEFDAFEEKAPAWNRAMRAIERRATKRILRDFLKVDLADLSSNSLTPSRFEYRFGSKHRDHVPDHPDAFIVDVDGVQLRVEGTIDRIDEGDGRYRIIDYKGGKALRHVQLGDKIDRGVRLQLALYAMAISDFFGIEPEMVSGIIRPVASTSIEPKKFAFELGEKTDGLRATLTTFVQSILRGYFPAFPDEDDFKSCTYCPVNHSCRTRHDARERREALRSGEPLALLRELL
ncbi:MAG: PD-(D/E)XK nuclease family protein, partial [Thermoanaerobaculia bacterium]|nr:PD-(D/E)XK nuclease family protein [Thermoanaerobaculia bacterium]